MQMLLDKGADINAQGENYDDALQAALERGHDSVMQILLDKGADVNARDGCYITRCRQRYMKAITNYDCY